MEKRTTKATKPPEPTQLIILKEKFKSELLERIAKGEEILRKDIQTNKDFKQLQSDYSSWHDYNLELLKQSFNEPYNEYRKSYSYTGNWSGMILRSGRTSSTQALKDLTNKFNSKINNLKKLVQKIDLLKSTEVEAANDDSHDEQKLEKSQVFIVHGHDDLTKLETARFIEKLGFKPIILHEQASLGNTIIEKIENYSNVGFGVVLYTPCDTGFKKGNETDLRDRARQNVVFEHGYLIGKIGRKNVAALVKGDVETPNDISGVVYISMNKDWKLDLAKELRSSGYPLDMNKVI
ncbi:TIR domain-containing protein [Abyssalbus ytuae]|uniref:Nucleotide-binding protein n=1 Tax=Abyssalbus ytuae TaxID=2926907 RepID=A0A9E7D433_9FLAO|nr:nucleotide-binding protein [Abyssalbus ytuae]UOB18474.1 nucleotide-binding protein [Abyssalbus ytuae]